MGGIAAKLGYTQPEVKVVMLGLDAAGKTSLLYRMKLNENVMRDPLWVVQRRIHSKRHDDAGARKMAHLYIATTDALVFVVDATDRERLDEAVEMLVDECLPSLNTQAPILVLANKQDIKGALSPAALTVVIVMVIIVRGDEGERRRDRGGGGRDGRGVNNDDEEADRRRLEAMVANAKWREGVRRENLRKHEEEEKREAEEEEKAAAARRRRDQDGADTEAAFLKDVQAEAWRSSSTASLADRVRRNVHYIQRTAHAMEQGLKRS
ncbi:hypothetical protein PTSG_05097 [Salpingoeca rosetta]|uniref:Uncharacterized protein n=1 Tax=Salpingoeca rosetta (strain ATCC 50818 / BSB-021) TaxID=946362 RepID=F2UAI6_SALR5|nr:uncharacterized protein PTSG_05097 [Salpingoeca rosetta]EGD73402.1 hypothetical protein PTSG_05097 [Salpingoeca rosetta]|eukprot:XP_004993684.1 hypothetical protein PTSG_05097 [Salpingoeca rosetta]